MTHIEQTFYGTVTKKDLLWKANMVMERFNNANSKSLMASYSFKFNTLSVFKRKVLQGVVSLEQMKEENAKRVYLYDEWY